MLKAACGTPRSRQLCVSAVAQEGEDSILSRPTTENLNAVLQLLHYQEVGCVTFERASLTLCRLPCALGN